MSNTENRNHEDHGSEETRACEGCGLHAFQAGLDIGYTMGHIDTMDALEAATEVEHVYRNGDYTVLEFSDGVKTKVKYDPSYGYAYDTEKAMMAALLKRIMGNHYIEMLKKFCPAGRDAGTSGREMLKRPAAQPLPCGMQDPDDEGMAGAFHTDDGWQDFLAQLDKEPEGCSACETDPETSPDDGGTEAEPDGLAGAFGGADSEAPDDGRFYEGDDGTGEDDSMTDAFPVSEGSGSFPDSDASFFGACE